MQHFLEQCLQSVVVAIRNVEAEVFVVDNNSVDGSVAMVEAKFPNVKLIANKDNAGFSKANNQAMRLAVGQYVLLLNPDTLVEEDTFEKVIAFMDSHPDAGGLGINMVDGKGNFLPESKRSLPTPEVAFYKIFGLSWLFPRSKRFGKYHLSYLDNNSTHEVEVLSGAFMLMRKEALDKVGLLDEDYFMYGEDIDLSYRIILGGYKNYYFPEARIIHYKGESTKKGSLNYVFVFYNAMAIFARKHFSKERAQLFSLLINFAILLRASVSLVSRFVKRISLPILDGTLIYVGLYLISSYWEMTVKAGEGLHYPEEFYVLVLPFYVFVWLISIYFSGGYDRPIKLSVLLRGSIIGSAIILIGYGLMGEEVRFSRAVILLGSAWVLAVLPLLRLALHLAKLEGFNLNSEKNKRFLVVGRSEEILRVEALLKDTFVSPGFIGHYEMDALGDLSRLDEFIRIHKIGEVIFCAKDIPAQRIIDCMTQTNFPEVDFKIAPIESMFLIGSNSINTAGDLYTFGINAISKPTNRRSKRLFDVFLSLTLLSLSPLLAWFMKTPFGFMRNIFLVLMGKRTWVGYVNDRNEASTFHLPKLADSVLDPIDGLEAGHPDAEGITRLNLMYAKDYRVANDLNIVFKGFRELGR